MILGIGVDIVSVKRFQVWMNKPGLVKRYFHPLESDEAYKKSGVLSLAARFAAKEAFGKALGTGMAGLLLKDIRVVTDEYGKPAIVLLGTAKKAFKARGGVRLHLSLSHEKENAIAMVVLEG